MATDIGIFYIKSKIIKSYYYYNNIHPLIKNKIVNIINIINNYILKYNLESDEHYLWKQICLFLNNNKINSVYKDSIENNNEKYIVFYIPGYFDIYQNQIYLCLNRYHVNIFKYIFNINQIDTFPAL